MGVPRKARSWRQCLADDYEEEYGPLPDPVATFGSELATAPPTPVLSSSIAEPDPLFINQLHDGIERIATSSSPTCLRTSSRVWPHDSSSDSDEPDAAPWSLQAYAARLSERALESPATDGEAIHSKSRRQQSDCANKILITPSPKRTRCDSNGLDGSGRIEARTNNLLGEAKETDASIYTATTTSQPSTNELADAA
ncbi:hypothetical protein BKA56DRAFT_656737 [Ilyonectria sp. MPI-CAGE-AT-0026]|nr:hypothetical protein BKA56DRAFT_656737 [Ilyonectria sp. MPI-CAGE-AT-0026]